MHLLGNLLIPTLAFYFACIEDIKLIFWILLQVFQYALHTSGLIFVLIPGLQVHIILI